MLIMEPNGSIVRHEPFRPAHPVSSYRFLKNATDRDQRAEVFATSAGYVAPGVEGDHPAIVGRRRLREIVQIGSGLEEVSRAT